MKRAPSFETSQARRFLGALFPFALRDHRLEFRIIRNNGTKDVRQIFHRDIVRMPWRRLDEFNRQGFGVYVGVCPRRGNGGAKEDAAQLGSLWADLDEKDFNGDKQRAFLSLYSLPPQLHPSMVVHSGHGLHGYWLLANPIPITDANRAHLEAILKGLQRAVGSDSVFDLSRVMRLAGSINVKDPAKPVSCRIISLDERRRFTLDDFQNFAVTDGCGPSASTEAEPIQFSAQLPDLKWRDLRVGGRIKRLIRDGWRDDREYRSRSEADQAVITALRQAGHTQDEIKAIFANPKWRIGEKFQETFKQQGESAADRYLSRSIRHADEFLSQVQIKDDPAILFLPSTSPPDLAKVKAVVTETFPDLWPATKAGLATMAAMLPSDVVNPPTLIYEGPSSGGKTTLIDFLDGTPYLGYRTDRFTPKSFVTHAVNVAGAELGRIDLLPRIRFRCMLTGELATLFRGRDEELTNNFTILTAVLDGRGYISDSGTRGRRGYEGDYLFAWIGATTPLPSRTWRLMQQLGSRLMFFDMGEAETPVHEIVTNLIGPKTYKDKLAACREAVGGFLLALFRAHAQKGQERPFGVEWSRARDPHSVVTEIAKLAQVVARARGVISVWENQSGELNHTPPNVEVPRRLGTLLYNLARGHALLDGRPQVTEADLPIVIRVGLDTMPTERRHLLRALIERPPIFGPWLRSGEVEALLKCSRPTALRIMNELAILGVARLRDDPDETGQGDRPTKMIALANDFGWLASDRVRSALRQEASQL